MSYRLDGWNELSQLLARLPQPMQERVAGAAAAAAARQGLKELRPVAPLHQGARSPASRTYGTLKENLAVQRLKPRRRTRRAVRVWTGDAFWAYFLEFGTVSQPARPWFRPAIDAAAPRLLDAMRMALLRGLEREARRLAGPYRSARRALR